MTSNNRGIEEKCIKELKLNEYHLISTSIKADTPMDDEEAGKFYVCTWTGREIMNEDGVIESKAAIEFFESLIAFSHLTDEARSQLLDTMNQDCVNVHGETARETAIKFKNCFVKLALDAGVIRAH